MIRRDLLAGFLTLAGLAATRPAGAQGARRVALAIGNGGYGNGVPALPNPPRDARAMAVVLGRLGFRTELLVDADGAASRAAIRQLGQAARGAEAALLFYAGHAAEVGGRNLLFPVSVSLRGAASLLREAVPYDEVATALSGQARTTLIFFDACRDNPFTGMEVAAAPPAAQPRAGAQLASRSVGAGLASVPSMAGTLIAFATAPGQVALDGNGQNSPFTSALLHHIETPDVEVRDMLTRVRRTVRQSTNGQQTPWDNSSLDVAFFMRTAAAPSASPGPTRRIVEEAAIHGIPLPPGLTEERFRRPAANAGPAAQLIGSWSSGERRWGGRTGRRNILVVLAVDEVRGTAETIFAQSAGGDATDDTAAARFRRRVMTVTGNTAMLEWTAPDGSALKFILNTSDTLTAILIRAGKGQAKVQMQRID